MRKLVQKVRDSGSSSSCFRHTDLNFRESETKGRRIPYITRIRYTKNLYFVAAMQDIEPHYKWRDYYISDEDPASPFYGRVYSEFEYTNTVYNYYIHPQWDEIGSPTLFVKLLYAGYEEQFAIVELIGEWNDCLHNDIMFLKRELIDPLMQEGITKFILLGEHVLNFHASDDSYYEEWFDEVDDGWIVLLNFRPHVLQEFKRARLDYYMIAGGKFSEFNWRSFLPAQLFDKVDAMVMKRLT